MLTLVGDEICVATQQVELWAVVHHHAHVVRDDLQVTARASLWNIVAGIAHLIAEAIALPRPGRASCYHREANPLRELTKQR